jgi:hypothetical protein
MYVCAFCGRTSEEKELCCGHWMAPEGSYVCKSCGNVSDQSGECCGQPMVRV